MAIDSTGSLTGSFEVSSLDFSTDCRQTLKHFHLISNTTKSLTKDGRPLMRRTCTIYCMQHDTAVCCGYLVATGV